MYLFSFNKKCAFIILSAKFKSLLTFLKDYTATFWLTICRLY